MTDYFVDFENGSDASAGTSWAAAELTSGAGINDMTGGDNLFIQRGGGTPTDETAASITWTLLLASDLGDENPGAIFGVQEGTTNEPPVASDLVIRGTHTLPKIEATAGNFDRTGFMVIYGLHMKSSSLMRPAISGAHWPRFVSCEFECASEFAMGRLGGNLEEYTDCDFISVSGSLLTVQSGAWARINGGLVSGTAPNTLLTLSSDEGKVDFTAFDLSALGSKTFTDLFNAVGCEVIFRNCPFPATYTFTTGTPFSAVTVKAIACNDATALGSSASIRDYEENGAQGAIDFETTAVRTGGANDGASGAFSYAMTPRINYTREVHQGLASPLFVGWFEGDGTSQTITIFIANSGASDYNEGDVWAELYTPSDAGTALHDLSYDDKKVSILPASPAALTDDTGSTWGTGADNHQKLVMTSSADYQGPLYVRVFFGKRFTSSAETLYLDPLPVVT